MNKFSNFLNNHWEKLLFAVVSLFCLYSLGVSFVGLLGTGNDQYIKNLDAEINKVLKASKVDAIDVQANAFVEFQKNFVAREGFDKYETKLMPSRLFNQEAKINPYEDIMDIAQGHSNVAGTPGVNCEKFFCKIKGENICLVCGSKGEREYKYNAPILTDLELIREDIRNNLQANPYVDRQIIRIIWEDDIETDRTTFKERKGSVIRIELTEKNEKELNDIFQKATYQKDLKDYIREHQIVPLKAKKDSYEIQPENIGGALYKAQAKEPEVKKEEKSATLNDLFKTEQQEKKDADNSGVKAKEVRLHKLHDDKVFYNFEDTSIEPLKKYAYILFETFVGETAVHKPLNEWKFSKPVTVTTSANNYMYLLRVIPLLDENRNPILGKDGKAAQTADIRIYQYFPLQNLFYKRDFKGLKVEDEVGAYMRVGESTKPFKTPIYKTKTEPLTGSMLTDEEWAQWKKLYPESLKARSGRIEVDQSFTIGAIIKEIGEEKVSLEIPDGRPTLKGYDEKGNPIYEQKTKTVEAQKKYILVEEILSKIQRKIYESSVKEITEEIETHKIKTIEDLKSGEK